MANYYNLDGIKTELNKRLTVAKEKKEAWEKVTFPTKKNGEPFAVLSRNFDGATLYTEAYDMQPGENRLRVGFWSNAVGYTDDIIYCYCHADELKEGDPRKDKLQNYQEKTPGLRQVYTYDLEDIKPLIIKRIESLEASIQTLTAELETAKSAYDTFREAYKTAEDALTNICKDMPTLRNMVVNTIVSRFPYC